MQVLAVHGCATQCVMDWVQCLKTIFWRRIHAAILSNPVWQIHLCLNVKKEHWYMSYTGGSCVALHDHGWVAGRTIFLDELRICLSIAECVLQAVRVCCSYTNLNFTHVGLGFLPQVILQDSSSKIYRSGVNVVLGSHQIVELAPCNVCVCEFGYVRWRLALLGALQACAGCRGMTGRNHPSRL